jgi:hypothetical protein
MEVSGPHFRIKCQYGQENPDGLEMNGTHQLLVSAMLIYESVSKSFRTGRLERKLQMVKLSATRCSCFAILWVRLVSFAAITLCVASQ